MVDDYNIDEDAEEDSNDFFLTFSYVTYDPGWEGYSIRDSTDEEVMPET